MELDKLIQLGGLGAIAVYLVYFLVKDVKENQKTQINILEAICEALNIPRSKR
jgi:hypothetical protein